MNGTCKCSGEKPDLWLFKWAAPSGSYICEGIPAMEGYQSGGIWEFLIPANAGFGIWGQAGSSSAGRDCSVCVEQTAGPAFPHPGEPCQSALAPWKCPQRKRLASLQCPSCHVSSRVSANFGVSAALRALCGEEMCCRHGLKVLEKLWATSFPSGSAGGVPLSRQLAWAAQLPGHGWQSLGLC